MNSTAINADAVFLHYRSSLIHTLARIVGCPQTAEDLAQDAYLKFVQASTTQEITFPQSFLFQIGRNLALDHLRKQRIRQPPTDETTSKQNNASLIEHIPATAPTPEQIVADQQQVALLLVGLQGLSERRRACLVLHRYYHWSYERIATHLGISRSAVEKNIHAAVAHLLASQGDGP